MNSYYKQIKADIAGNEVKTISFEDKCYKIGIFVDNEHYSVTEWNGYDEEIYVVINFSDNINPQIGILRTGIYEARTLIEDAQSCDRYITSVDINSKKPVTIFIDSYQIKEG